MNPDDSTLRRPDKISSLDQLATAKRKASINATQDKLRLKSNLNDLKARGPVYLLRTVVVPAAAAGVAFYGVAKLVGVLTAPSRDPALPPGQSHAHPAATAVGQGTAGTNYTAPPAAVPPGSRPWITTATLIKLAPIALQVARYGVGYLERNGTEVPEIVHQLLAGPKGR